MMKIGANIRKIREFRGFTQEFVADKLSLTQQAYSRWENDESDIPSSKLEKIAQILNIRISDIFGLDDKFIFNNNYNNNKIEQGMYQSIDKGLSEREILLYETQIKEHKETISYLQEQVKLLQEKLFGKMN